MEKRSNLVAFWLLGLFNNSIYVIMLAGAKEIDSGGVGLVFLADVAPTFLIKLTAPYWFPFVSYHFRSLLAAALMASSLTTVAVGKTLTVQLIGVCLCSIQSGIGEASTLGLTSLYDGPSTITAWSSGTGFAGIMGYAWVVFFHLLCDLSFSNTLLLALVIPLAWCLTFFFLLEDPSRAFTVDRQVITEVNAALGGGGKRGTIAGEINGGEEYQAVFEEEEEEEEEWTDDRSGFSYTAEEVGFKANKHIEGAKKRAATTTHHEHYYSRPPRASPPHHHTFREKLHLFYSLWRYVIPLVVVYFSEYSLQSGAWGAIGFPVTSEEARKKFYSYANWCYQVGVFISRSSGLLIPPSMLLLWVMPALQTLLLIFFIMDGIWHFWYDWGLLSLCLFSGLLGGGVYVSAFRLISEKTSDCDRELAMVSASISDTVGIMLSDIAGLVIQGCLYRVNNISGATISCGKNQRT